MWEINSDMAEKGMANISVRRLVAAKEVEPRFGGMVLQWRPSHDIDSASWSQDGDAILLLIDAKVPVSIEVWEEA